MEGQIKDKIKDGRTNKRWKEKQDRGLICKKSIHDKGRIRIYGNDKGRIRIYGNDKRRIRIYRNDKG